MLIHYLSLSWDQLKKYRLQSAVSIVSLAIGFACFALASMWIKYETTYDAFHKDADRMYFLTEDRSMLGNQSEVENRINKAFCDTLFKHCPEIVEMTKFEYRNLFDANDASCYGILCDSSFLDFFQIKFLAGDRGFLKREGEVAITRERAEELWPYESPLGKEIIYAYEKRRVITAVVEGWGEHTNTPFDFISGNMNPDDFSVCHCAVRLSPHADVRHINQRIDTLKIISSIRDKYGELIHRRPMGSFELIPATKLRHRLSVEDTRMEVQIHHIYLFALAGGLLILCGLLNYLTMFVNRLFIRQREIALRTVFGATGWDLMAQFLVEYGLVLLIATGMGMYLMRVFLDKFRLLAQLPKGTDYFYREGFFYLLLVVFVSLLISLPFIRFFRRQALQNSIQPQVGLFSYSNFRKLSVCLQIGISIFFIFCTIVMMKQIDTLRHSDIGFSRHNMGIVLISMLDENGSMFMLQRDAQKQNEKVEVTYNYLNQLPDVLEVTRNTPIFPIKNHRTYLLQKYDSNGTPVHPDMVDDECHFQTITHADNTLSDFYNLQLLKGRFFEEGDDQWCILINEAAARQFHWPNPVGRQILLPLGGNPAYTIVGVVKDFLNYGTTTPAKPYIICHILNYGSNYCVFKYRPGTWNACKEKLEEYAKQINVHYDFFNVEEEYEKLLKSEKNLQILLFITAGVCILIALFGVWSMIMLTCEQRRKEIAIRKVYGATTKDILDMFIIEYMTLQGIAAIVAFPIGYACMKPWLEQYVVQTSIPWWIYVGIFMAVAMLVALCVGWRVWKTAKAKPADEIE
ncbi:MAG: ABC transporter permease [Bacteroidaceae bacterium]|nr:ABC transporter permease [Bacteroidaceae bacterium]